MGKGSYEDTPRPVVWSQTRGGRQSGYAGVSQSEGVDITSDQAGARPTALAEAKYGPAVQRLEDATCVKASSKLLKRRRTSYIRGSGRWPGALVVCTFDGNDNTLRI